MPMTRQLRLNDLSIIKERIKEFAGKKINLVLRDDRVSTGTLIDIQKDYVTVLNMRNKPMHFNFTDISELYFDTLDKC
jgi:hypothetical protein